MNQVKHKNLIIISITKKLICPEHQLLYSFKCEDLNCVSPFVCQSEDCIDSHLHEDTLVMTRFQVRNLQFKIPQIQETISDETMNQNIWKLKYYIENLKNLIQNIIVDLKKIDKNYYYLEGDLENPLKLDYVQKVQENYQIYLHIKKNMQKLKNKVKIQFPLKGYIFPSRNNLIDFLAENIPNFNWSKSKELYNSNQPLITCENFHEKLKGLKKLLFIFIEGQKILGSYFAGKYPTLNQKQHKKDTKSFIFINTHNNLNNFIKFKAQENADHHLSISENYYICHGNSTTQNDGIQTSHKNLSQISYCLPSNSFKNDNQTKQYFNGVLTMDFFMILQTNSDIFIAKNEYN